MQQQAFNKIIIRDFYRRAIGQGDITFAEAVTADDYVQHSPLVKPGKAGLLEALTYMKQMPKPASPAPPFMRLLADGDYVVTNLSFNWGGHQKAVVDVFRLRDGQIAEHWDAVQDAPDVSLNGNALMDGPLPLADPSLTSGNKALVQAYYQQVMVERNLTVLSNFVAPNLIQHRPEIANGLHGLATYWQQSPASLRVENRPTVLGEADFVVVQYEGRPGERIATFYDIFRLSAGKIVEQWGVQSAKA